MLIQGTIPHLPAAGLVEAGVTRETRGVVLVGTVATLVVLLVHVVGVLLGVLVSLDPVNLIHTLALGELVNLGANKTSQGLLGKRVLNGLAYMGMKIKIFFFQCCERISLTLLALVVLPGLHTGKGSGTSNELVRELALVLLLAVHLAVSIVRFA